MRSKNTVPITLEKIDTRVYENINILELVLRKEKRN